MKYFYLFLGILWIVGCTPFIDSRREAGKIGNVGQSRPNRIAICYNGFFTEPEELQKIADEACAATNHKAVRSADAYFNCAFFLPSTAFFDCKPKN